MAEVPHGWHFNFSWKGVSYRVSLDRECGRHIDSKTEADTEADRIRGEIRAGRFQNGATQPPADHSATVAELGTIFLERYSKARGKVSWKNDQTMLTKLAGFVVPRIGRPFGTVSVRSVMEDDCDVFLESLRARALAASTRNNYLQTLKAVSAWGVRKGYLETPWIKSGSDLKREKIAKRERRLLPDEESTLLGAASAGLFRLIVAALETGCRLGELLSLRWRHVDLERSEITIHAVNAKARTVRHIPIVARLRAVIEMARVDPAGHRFGPEAFVFGDAVGCRLKSPKKAWATAVLKAHGHTPTWVKSDLSPASREAYRAIDLKFHDLRHEAGSRWLEAGIPLHHVKELLGHASISTTDTYLNAGRIHLHESMRKVDATRNILHKSCTNDPVELPVLCNDDPVPPPKSLIKCDLGSHARVAQLDRATAS